MELEFESISLNILDSWQHCTNRQHSWLKKIIISLSQPKIYPELALMYASMQPPRPFRILSSTQDRRSMIIRSGWLLRSKGTSQLASVVCRFDFVNPRKAPHCMRPYYVRIGRVDCQSGLRLAAVGAKLMAQNLWVFVIQKDGVHTFVIWIIDTLSHSLYFHLVWFLSCYILILFWWYRCIKVDQGYLTHHKSSTKPKVNH
jgi:hypothetical protein